MKIKAHLILPSIQELKKSVGLDKGEKVQQYIDNFVFEECEPYLPGHHIHEASVSSNHPGSGQVVWVGPDVEYLYEGKLMVDPITKVGAFPIRGGKISFDEKDGGIEGFVSRHGVDKIMDPKGRDLKYYGAGKRGSKWFDNMIKDKTDDLIEGVQNIVDGGKK